ncbi:MAG: hypothetical protein ABH858_01060 [Candidatus Omnitrophota bacterium]
MSIIFDALNKLEEDKKSFIPKRKKKKISLFIFLSIFFFFVFIVYEQFGRKGIFAGKTGLVDRPVLTNNPVLVEKPIGASDTPVLKETPAASSEPLAQREVVSRPNYILEGIVYDGKVPLAIINGKVLKKNDRLGDIEILEITSDTVDVFDRRAQTKIHLTF